MRMTRNWGVSSNKFAPDSSDSYKDSPLAMYLLNAPLPRFKMPPLERCDGTEDPGDRIHSYKSTMKLHGAKESLMCLAFPTTLQKSTKDWLNDYPLVPYDPLRIYPTPSTINLCK